MILFVMSYRPSRMIHTDVFNRLVEFIENLDVPLEHISDNL